VFSTLISVFGYPDETLSLVFDILRQDFHSSLKTGYKLEKEQREIEI